MATWGMAKAKAQLSEVVYEAEKSGPQTLSRSGREVAVVVSMEEWKRLRGSGVAGVKPKQSMAEYLLSTPLKGSGLKVPKLNWKLGSFEP